MCATRLFRISAANIVPPKPDGLVADVDPALGQKILDVAQRQRVSHVRHHDQTDDLWRAVEISERVAHGLKLAQPHAAPEFALTEPTRARQRCIWALAPPSTGRCTPVMKPAKSDARKTAA
jgi:hypothetical protein